MLFLDDVQNLDIHAAIRAMSCLDWVPQKSNSPSGQLPAGGWPGARAGWLAARVHPVSLRFMHDACMI